MEKMMNVTVNNAILESREERILDRNARFVALLIHKETYLPVGEFRPCSHAVNVCERKLTQYHCALRAVRYDIEVTEETVEESKIILMKAIMSLQDKYHILDRHYDLQDDRERDKVIDYVDAFINRATYYARERNEMARYRASRQ